MLQDIFMYGRRGVVVITTAQLHSKKSEIRLMFKFCSQRVGHLLW